MIDFIIVGLAKAIFLKHIKHGIDSGKTFTDKQICEKLRHFWGQDGSHFMVKGRWPYSDENSNSTFKNHSPDRKNSTTVPNKQTTLG